jgi:hypothetical protein
LVFSFIIKEAYFAFADEIKVNNTEKQIKINFIFFKLNCKINIKKKAFQFLII